MIYLIYSLEKTVIVLQSSGGQIDPEKMKELELPEDISFKYPIFLNLTNGRANAHHASHECCPGATPGACHVILPSFLWAERPIHGDKSTARCNSWNPPLSRQAPLNLISGALQLNREGFGLLSHLIKVLKISGNF